MFATNRPKDIAASVAAIAYLLSFFDIRVTAQDDSKETRPNNATNKLAVMLKPFC